MPTVEKVGGNFAFSFDRNLDALVDTTTIFQYSPSLLSDDWTDVELTAPEVTLGAELDGMQAVDVMLSEDKSVDEKLFGRIKVIYDN
ncbi:hypothetical protein OAI07_02045 [Akkermansiaceae bacterium]|nr:hypothetical protein [Akkermansiaceae bacterium]